jgi:hypothetical protein
MGGFDYQTNFFIVLKGRFLKYLYLIWRKGRGKHFLNVFGIEFAELW